MLVLSRAETEAIRFRDLGIRVKVLKLQGNRVRIGIDAPREVAIVRDELHDESSSANLPGSTDATGAGPHLQLAIHQAQEIREMIRLGMVDSVETALAGLQSSLEFLKLQELRLEQTESRRRQRGLVVDDNLNESSLLASYLRLEDFEVVTASHGAQALECLSGEAIDFVLLDMNMPQLDGCWTLSEIRRSEGLRHLNVFAISGMPHSHYGIDIGPTGCNAWFEKPVDPHRIVQEIRTATCAGKS